MIFFYAESQSLDPRSSLDARSVVWLSVIMGLGLPGKEKTPDCFSFKNINIFQFNYSLVVFILRIKEFVSPAATRWSRTSSAWYRGPFKLGSACMAQLVYEMWPSVNLPAGDPFSVSQAADIPMISNSRGCKSPDPLEIDCKEQQQGMCARAEQSCLWAIVSQMFSMCAWPLHTHRT